MNKHRRFTTTVFTVTLVLTAQTWVYSETAKIPPTSTSRLLVELSDQCPTPDGMTLDQDGNIILACPNYGDMSKPAVFMKIDREDKLSLYATCPTLEKTVVFRTKHRSGLIGRSWPTVGS